MEHYCILMILVKDSVCEKSHGEFHVIFTWLLFKKNVKEKVKKTISGRHTEIQHNYNWGI